MTRKGVPSAELLVLTTLSALTHFWNLFTPSAIVFDEVHYRHFAARYLDGLGYFDVHPPLASLLYAGVARLFGISAATLLGTEPTVELRLLPALLGTCIVPLVYLILRQLGAARRVATLGAFAVLCENALLVDSRLTLIEPLLITFGLLAVTFYLAARPRSGATRWMLLAASALFAGLALSCKWTGASALGLIGVTWLIEQPRMRTTLGRLLAEGTVLVAMPACVYFATFAVHFHLGPQATTTPLLSRVVRLHERMLQGNHSLELVAHAAASPWYTWPIMKHPIALWQDKESVELSSRHMALIGNPVVWWSGLIVVGLALIQVARHRGLPPRDRFAVAFLAGGLLFNFVPFIGIRRVMYLYHYLFALVFLVMLATYCGGLLTGWNDDTQASPFAFPSRRSAMTYYGFAALVLIGFIYFLPFTYGWPLSQASYDQRFWVLHPLF